MSTRLMLLLCLCACTGKGSAPPVAATPAAVPKPTPLTAPEPPGLRLPTNVLPTHYAVDLHLDPSQPTFTGAIDIDLEVKAPTQVIWLSAEEITVTAAKLGNDAVEAGPMQNEMMPFVAKAPIPAGKARLRVEYTGKISDRETLGVFRQKSGDDWYLFTQFEATDARRAFPCFDEPSFKVPWRLVIHAKKGDVAFSNTNVAEKTPGEGGGTAFRFNETKPLPSYLVAFAVGPIETVDGGKSKNGVPVRILVPRGRADEASYAAKVTVEILDTLEAYFGIPYGYEKLDSVFIPRTVGFGAMENPGLITYNETLILAKPGEDSIGRQRRYAMVAAHEIAHQWFGDLVTLAWWNDIWLNEAFASWAENKLMELWKPSWDRGVERVSDRTNALAADTLTSARQIRQPIESMNDIANAFDGITYAKGASVISMFELWAGKDKFQKGVTRYLNAHLHQTATSEDFLQALGDEIGPELPAAFKTFLEQPGAPVVHAELDCSAKTAKLKLKQNRFLPTGAEAKPQSWHIPVCARWSGKSAGQTCTLLVEESGELALPVACGAKLAVYPNAGAGGYYITDLAGELRRRVFADPHKLTLGERVGLISDVGMLVENGSLPAAEALALVQKIDPASDRHLARAALGGFRQAGLLLAMREDVVPDALRPQWARYIQKLFGAKARKLGFTPKAGEDDDVRLLRPLIVGTVVTDGEDKQLIAEAKRLTLLWLEDRKAVAPDVVATVLKAAARNADAALYDKLVAEAKQSKSVKSRTEILTALASVRDPALIAKNRELVMSDALDIREVSGLALSGTGEDATRQATWDWFKQNYDALSAKLPEPARPYMIRIAGGFCDEEHAGDVQAFFADKTKNIRGGPRVLKATIDKIRSCAHLRAAQQPSAVAFLKKL